MIYNRASGRDWDQWGEIVSPDWRLEKLLSYLRRVEAHHGGETALHGGSGLVQIHRLPSPSPLYREVIGAARDLGYPETDDFAGAEPEGWGLPDFTIDRRGRRCSADDAYLPLTSLPKSLTIERGAAVSLVLFEAGRASGVEFVYNGEKRQVHADANILLCSGALETWVQRPAGRAARYRHGHIALPAGRRGFGPPPSDQRRIDGVQTMVPSAQARPWRGNDGRLLDCYPRSRGRLEITSADLSVAPAFYCNGLFDIDDVANFVRAYRLMRGLCDHPSMRAIIRAMPPTLPDPHEPAAVEEWPRQSAMITHHPVGSCRMGADRDAVVDPRCRVNGVGNKRVVDASIFPQQIGGNPNVPIMAIAEMIANDVLERVTVDVYGLRSSE